MLGSPELDTPIALNFPPDSGGEASMELEAKLAEQRKKDEYMENLYRELGAIANTSLSSVTINHVLNRNFPKWKYSVGEIRGRPASFLRRIVDDPFFDVEIPEPSTRGQNIRRSRRTLAIVLGEEVYGRDIQYLITTEKAYLEQERKKASWLEGFRGAAKSFHACENVYQNKDDLFTQKQTIVLSLMTHCRDQEELAEALQTSPSTLTRLLKPARENFTSGPTSYIELTLIAISLRIASIDHIPEGKTSLLNEEDKELLTKYFSFDPEERADIRSKPQGTLGSRWRRVYKKNRPNKCKPAYGDALPRKG
jgi:hypothetical protein